MGSLTNGTMDAMPFKCLNNYELLLELQSSKSFCLDKLENNGFMDFMKKYKAYAQEELNPVNTCKYYDTEALNKDFSSECGDLRVLHMNIRRLAKHKGEFIAFLSTIDLSFDILILSEIGDDANNYMNDNFLPEYNVFSTTPKHNKYGGIAILIKKGLGSVKIRDDLGINHKCECSKCQIEDKWLELEIANKTHIIGGVYRHPNGSVNHFISGLEDTLAKIPDNVNCTLAGDFNVNLLNYEQPTSFDYFTTLSSYNFLPYITMPTRIQDSKATLIDHIFVKLSKKLAHSKIKSGNIFCDISDHLPNFIILYDNSNRKTNEERPLIRIFSENNIDTFKNSLENTDWDQLIQDQDTNTCYEKFYTHVSNLYDKCFPLVRLSRKRSKDKKWITSALKNSIKHKDKLCKKQSTQPTNQNKKNYTLYRNELTKLLRQAEIMYYKNQMSDKKTSVTNFWKLFGQTLNHN